MVCLCCEGSGRAPAIESVEQDGEDRTRALPHLFTCILIHMTVIYVTIPKLTSQHLSFWEIINSVLEWQRIESFKIFLLKLRFVQISIFLNKFFLQCVISVKKINMARSWLKFACNFTCNLPPPSRLAQLDRRWSNEREFAGSNPNKTNIQGLKITEENVLSLLWQLQTVRHFSLLG